MALQVPDWQIDETDPRIKEIICRSCFGRLFVEIGSDCDTYSKCTRCLGSGKIIIVNG